MGWTAGPRRRHCVGEVPRPSRRSRCAAGTAPGRGRGDRLVPARPGRRDHRGGALPAPWARTPSHGGDRHRGSSRRRQPRAAGRRSPRSRGYTSLLLNRWDRLADDQKRMMLEQVNHDADRVTRLITELLDISRLEIGPAGAAPPAGGPARAWRRPWWPRSRLEYPEPSKPDGRSPRDFPKVYADPDKLEQVLDQPGRERLQVRLPARAPHRGRCRAEASVSVAVTDRGEGIPPARPAEGLHQVLPPRRRAARPGPGSGCGSAGAWWSRTAEVWWPNQTAGRAPTFRFTLPLIDSTIDETAGTVSTERLSADEGPEKIAAALEAIEAEARARFEAAGDLAAVSAVNATCLASARSWPACTPCWAAWRPNNDGRSAPGSTPPGGACKTGR